MRYFVIFLIWLALALPSGAQQAQVRSVITAQINAFLVDDFETAFGFAAPKIKQIFMSPEQFGNMVTRAYPMVHRPSDFQFKGLMTDAQGVTQNVLIRDVQGTYYLAKYMLIETDNGWKISGVKILRAAGVGA